MCRMTNKPPPLAHQVSPYLGQASPTSLRRPGVGDSRADGETEAPRGDGPAGIVLCALFQGSSLALGTYTFKSGIEAYLARPMGTRGLCDTFSGAKASFSLMDTLCAAVRPGGLCPPCQETGLT